MARLASAVSVWCVRGRNALCTALALLLLTTPAAQAQEATQKVRFGFGFNSISPIIIDILIPEYLGYYRAEGLSVDALALGSDAALFASIESKRIEFSIGTAAFQLPRLARGEKLPSIDFYESTYPFKFGMAVKATSPIKSFADLKGKRIGVIGFGNANYVVAQKVLQVAGLDPQKDVSWLAVGLGTVAGLALDRGDIDALFYDDTGFGQIEANGMPLAYLPLPPQVPQVGGLFLSASTELLQQHRAWAVGFGRGVSKAHVFIQENSEAAAYVFARMFPEALPKGKSLEDQVKAVMVPVVKRMPLYSSYDKTIEKWGYIKTAEWQDEIDLAGYHGKIQDMSAIFTDDLIDDINNFDVEAIKAEAHNFKLPYKTQ
jgi:NitT/TauT family transport system substrate-binding protein